MSSPSERSTLSEPDLIAGLRRRDEAAFMELVERYHQQLVRLAMSFVSTPAAAEDVVQETWLGVLKGIDRFEERSSLKTWIFRILTNRAKTRGVRDSRVVPFSALAAEETGEGPSVEPERFFGPGHRIEGHWAVPPTPWAAGGEERALSRETREVIGAAIDALPPAQRTVISLRDVEGVDAEEVCRLLDLTEGNQRVLLHRARTKVRRALEDYFASGEEAA
ncbi:MAG: polymerase sigma-70 factor, subfamily [Thermoleophilaceae bacterium]|jgi:RNA polymerase sigma-70 factor (ECF subfamily)|nr:polymerase sigma-70 factor, subfamily [Thermoleophilaceae bacterium]